MPSDWSVVSSAGAAVCRPAPTAPDLPLRLQLVLGRLQRRVRVDVAGPLPPLQLAVLTTLEVPGRLPLGALAELEGVSAPTMSRVVASLEQRGLVERGGDRDGRRRIVRLSGAGTTMLALARDQETAFLARRLGALDAAQRSAVRAALPLLEALLIADA